MEVRLGGGHRECSYCKTIVFGSIRHECDEMLRAISKDLKPIHKYNSGNGATLCHKCSVIISVGFTDDLFCNDCKPKEK